MDLSVTKGQPARAKRTRDSSPDRGTAWASVAGRMENEKVSASATAPARQSRRTYLIDRGFQLKYAAMLMVAGALVSALFGAMMFLAHSESQRVLENALGMGGIAVPSEVQLQMQEVDSTLV